MRKVGEVNISGLAQAKKSGRMAIRLFTVNCKRCGYECNFSQSGARRVGGSNNWLCRKCKADDEKEIASALVNLAKKKGFIKSK